uniref:Uncharacterized protein n=1 Tax=Janibacter limosus TaxID=53458 RepID=A0AC61U979_9MICO|nr:hypothetical protein [Janibacter limosus]
MVATARAAVATPADPPPSPAPGDPHVPSNNLPSVRQDQLGRLRPARRPVMKGVPGSQRCPGHSAPAKGAAASRNPLARLFGRG